MEIQRVLPNYWHPSSMRHFISPLANHIYFRNDANHGDLFSIGFLFATLATEAHTYVVNVPMSIRTTN